MAEYARRPRSIWSRGAWPIPAFVRGPRSHALRRRPNGRAIPTAARSIPEPAGPCRRRCGRRELRPGRVFRCVSTWRGRRTEVSAPLTYREFHEGETGAVVVAKPEVWGDALIGRRDVPASYHIACTLDDHAQGVTDVVRGADLEAATGLHRLLQALLGAQDAGLPPSPAGARRRGRQAFEEQIVAQLARFARAGGERGRYPRPIVAIHERRVLKSKRNSPDRR